MTERVGIVAVAQTKYENSKLWQSDLELVYEVVEKVREETDLKFTDDGTGIESTVQCSSDHFKGGVISNIETQSAVGANGRPEEKVASDGAFAVYYAIMQILSGKHDIVLVTANCKESGVSRNQVENFGLEPFFHRKVGLDYRSAAAMQANAYMTRYGITPEQCAGVVVKNRKNAFNNPLAQEPMNIDVSEVMGSDMLAYPIRALEAKPISDGACALILARESIARKITDRPVWIDGFGSCYDAHYLGDRDLADSVSLKKAAERAYKMAGISRPRQEIDVVEVSEEYSYQELLWAEGLGFCDPGDGGKLIDSGVTASRGELPINPSGGLLSGVPTIVAGMSRVCEAALQLRGEAGARQVTGAKCALAHGTAGPCGQVHSVMILRT